MGQMYKVMGFWTKICMGRKVGRKACLQGNDLLISFSVFPSKLGFGSYSRSK